MLAVAALGTGAMAQTTSSKSAPAPVKAAPAPKAQMASDKKVGEKPAHKSHKHVIKPVKAETK